MSSPENAVDSPNRKRYLAFCRRVIRFHDKLIQKTCPVCFNALVEENCYAGVCRHPHCNGCVQDIINNAEFLALCSLCRVTLFENSVPPAPFRARVNGYRPARFTPCLRRQDVAPPVSLRAQPVSLRVAPTGVRADRPL